LLIENEISGDVLLELTLASLKELEISSFGKRYHIMNSIMILKEKYGGYPTEPSAAVPQDSAIASKGKHSKGARAVASYQKHLHTTHTIHR